MTTELCRQLRRRTDKPHIFMHFGTDGWFYAASNTLLFSDEPWLYCTKVNPGSYRTPGDAARAWHNYKAPGAQGEL